MKISFFVLVLAVLLLEACTRPLAVFHWSAKEAALTRKKGYGFPTHNKLSRLICFDKLCLNKKERKNRQQKRRFRGYKNNRPVEHEKKPGEFSNQ